MPPDVWNKIESRLDEKKPKSAIWWKVAVVIGVALISGVVAYCLLNNTENQEKAEVAVSEQNQNQTSAGKEKDGSSKPTESSAIEGLEYNKVASPKAVATSGNNVEKAAQKNASPIFPKTKDNKIEEIIAEGTNPFILNVAPFGLKELPAALDLELPGKLSGLLPKLHKTELSRWQLGISAIQNRAGMAYTVNPQNGSYVHKNYLKRMQEGEFMAGNVQLGMSIGYKLSKRFSLLSGINYSVLSNGQNFNFSDEIPVTMMPGNSPDKFGNYPIIGYFTPSVPNVTNYRGFSKTSFVEIPVGLTYEHQLNKKWSVIPMVSINTARITEENGYTLDYQLLSAVPRQAEWFRKTVFTASSGLGIYKNVNRNVSLGAAVSGMRNLSSVYIPDASIKPRAWSVGMGMQLIWRIDR